jgi:hypothetical protein
MRAAWLVRMLHRGADPNDEEELAQELAGAAIVAAAALGQTELEITLPPAEETEPTDDDDE